MHRLISGSGNISEVFGYSHSYQYAGDNGILGNMTSYAGMTYTYSGWPTGCNPFYPAPSQALPHAVKQAGSDYHCYDKNGNMTIRTVGTTIYTQLYDVENRLTQITQNDSTTITRFSYDAAGQRTKTEIEAPAYMKTTVYYPFPTYEEEVRQSWQPCADDCQEGDRGRWVTTATVKRSIYRLAGQTIATRISDDPLLANNGLFYFLLDNLGSTSLLVTAAGVIVSGTTAYYLPYGGYRSPAPNGNLTNRGFTGHRQQDNVGLIYMNARYYVPNTNRFISADTIVPNPANPQSYNRYSYVLNNPVKYTDPSGHGQCNTNDNCISQPYQSSLPPRPPKNPWALTEDMFDLNGDGMVTWREEQEALQYYGSAEFAAIAEQILLDSLVPPTDATINPFGGPMTSTNCGVTNRPPCDARHPGVDSSTGEANRGDPIYAAAYGRIVRTGATNPALDGQGATGGFGHYVIVEHDVYGVKFYSIYAHNGTVLVAAGDIVSGGDQIATMGDSGTQIVHLHFEIRKPNNIDWNADNPFQTQVYWPATATEMKANFVDIGSVFGYNTTYADWAKAHP